MTSVARCPSPIDLERAFWSGAPEVQAHAEDCADCGAAWAEMTALVQAGRGIQPPASSAGRKEELRTALLSAGAREDAASAAPRRPVRRSWIAAPLAAAAAVACALAGWAIGRQDAPVPAPARAAAPPVSAGPVRRATVLDHGEARYLLASASPDEIVRLVEGTLTVEVDPLRRGERFRVLTGDGEVEVRGTAFDVTARADCLVGVRVMHGIVEVRAGDTVTRLTAGQSWQAPPKPPETLAAAPGPGVVAAPAAEEASGGRAEGSSRRGPEVGQLPVEEPATARSVGPSPLSPPLPAALDDPEPVAAPEVGPGPEAAPAAVRSPAQRAFDEGFRALRAGDFAAAASSFAEVEASGGEDRIADDAAFWRAVALARAGRGPDAIAAFRAFLSAHPGSTRAGEASAMFGWLLVDRGERAEAEPHFRRALRDPSERVRRSATQGMAAATRRP